MWSNKPEFLDVPGLTAMPPARGGATVIQPNLIKPALSSTLVIYPLHWSEQYYNPPAGIDTLAAINSLILKEQHDFDVTFNWNGEVKWVTDGDSYADILNSDVMIYHITLDEV